MHKMMRFGCNFELCVHEYPFTFNFFLKIFYIHLHQCMRKLKKKKAEISYFKIATPNKAFKVCISSL